jgi:hypothetical protein
MLSAGQKAYLGMRGARLWPTLVVFGCLGLLWGSGCGRTGALGTTDDVAAESDCSNGIDDDVDGRVDCADSDCRESSFCLAGGENCGNGQDDDGDGAVDCADPDCRLHPLCGGPVGEDCGNERDDDGDGDVDCADADCLDAPECVAGEENCGNERDDDGDGRVDCDDSDCEDHRLCRETGEENCVNGIDDDLDGRVDCLDIDCSGHPACGELKENCVNGRDDDEDGAIDCDDRDCREDPFCADRPEICINRVDDDGDDLVDCDDPDCFTHPDCRVQPGREICNNGIDDDDDGDVDCADSDCRSLPICREPGNEVCDNARDDDDDGAVDCADPDCFDSPSCVDRVCRPSVDFGVLAPRGSSVTRLMDNRGRVDRYDSPCAVPGGGEVVGRFRLSAQADLDISYRQLGGDHVLSLFRAGLAQPCNANPISCFDPESAQEGSFSATALPAGDYYLFAEAFSAGLEGQIEVTLSTGSATATEICNNGVDDDGDGATDCADLDCVLSEACLSLQCRSDENVGTLILDGPPRTVTVNTATGDNQIEETCAAGGGRDRVIRLVMPEAGGIAVRVRQRGWHVYGLHPDLGPGQPCLADRRSCFDSNDRRVFTIAYDAVDKGVYYFGVDALEPGQEGEVQLSFSGYGNRGPELCSNGVDDDGDGLTDCLDLDCIGVVGCQGPVCIPKENVGALRTGGPPARIELDTTSANNSQTLSCALGGGNDEVIAFELTEVSGLRINCRQTGDHVIGLFAAGGSRDACDARPENCADPGTGPISCNFVFPNLQPGRYYLIVEAFRPGDEGSMTLNLSAVPDHAQEICDNGLDDDNDGQVDCRDANCLDAPSCQSEACLVDAEVGLLQKDGPARSAALQTVDGDRLATSCVTAPDGGDRVVAFSLAQRSDVVVDYLQFGDHVLALYEDRGREFPCDTRPVACLPTEGDSVGSLRFGELDPGEYYLVVDATGAEGEGAVSVKLAAR